MSTNTATTPVCAKPLAPSYQATNFGITQLFSLSGVIFGWLWYEYGLLGIYAAAQQLATLGGSLSSLGELAGATFITVLPAIVWHGFFSRKAIK